MPDEEIDFAYFSDVLDLTEDDIQRLDSKLRMCYWSSAAQDRDFKDLIYEVMKIARNEEEQKFIWFRLGQLEMLFLTESEFHVSESYYYIAALYHAGMIEEEEVRKALK